MDFQIFHRILSLQQRYAQILDSNDISGWPELFTEQCAYKLQSRENFDAGHALCILNLESRAMLRDRVYGVVNTIFHDPYSQRHICGAPIVTLREDGGYDAESSYVVIRTQRDNMPHIVSVGRYLDRIVSHQGLLLFQQRSRNRDRTS